MVLSDVDIIKRVGNGSLEIEPYKEINVGPASLDLRLSNQFKKASEPHVYGDTGTVPISLSDDTGIDWTKQSGEITLSRDEFVLASTLETISMPDDLTAQILGRSSFGRLGISVHQTAGFIDPGFKGQITLELSNHGPRPVKLQAGQRVCQIVFTELSCSAMSPYNKNSTYQNQSGPTESNMEFN